MLAALYFDEKKLASSLKAEFERIWKMSNPIEIQLCVVKTNY
jgi:hypothetical protein